MKIFAKLLLVFAIFFLLPQKIYASNFSTDYKVIYSIQENSDANVNLNVVLTNLSQNFYASSYDVTVGFKDIRDLKASEENTIVSPIKNIQDGKTTIHIPFDNKVVGLGNKLSFNLSFKTSEVAKNLQNVWEVNIPGISDQNDFSNFQAIVEYPSFLGKPTYIKPSLKNITQQPNANTIIFTKEDLGLSGISIAFGNLQTYDFNLKYHLENTNLFTIETEVSLPPDTNYQNVYIEDISPKPKNVVIDKDSNWIAKFDLNPSERKNITVKGFVNINLYPEKEKITKDQINEYTKQQNYWESQNPKILNLARTINTPRKIYDYVVGNLHYDFSRVEGNKPRLGALNSLQNPDSAVCLEFTDLFIALSRASGIPAREISGYAYTDNGSQRPLSLIKDVLHAWPEYYDFDKGEWIMVDPTWGNTTGGVDYFNVLDFDHFAFVINGVNSSFPIPAGGYKFSNNLSSKDVNVSIIKSKKPRGSLLKPVGFFENEYLSALPISGTIQIQNVGDSISNNQKLSIESITFTPYWRLISISNIPPYGNISIPISFDKTSILTNKKDTIKIQLGESAIYKTISVYPFFLGKFTIIGGILIACLIFIISATYVGYRRLSFLRQKRRSDLLRESNKPAQKSF